MTTPGMKRTNYLQDGVGHLALQDGTTALVSPEDFDTFKDYLWRAETQKLRSGREYATVRSAAGSLHRLVAKRAHGEIPVNMVVDHANRDTRDNRRNNIRLATLSESGRNRGSWGASKHKGVHKGRGPNAGKWIFSLQAVCDTEEEAARLYNKAARLIYGEFAVLNDVPDTDDDLNSYPLSGVES